MDTRRWREKETQSVTRTGALRGSAQPLWQGGWEVPGNLDGCGWEWEGFACGHHNVFKAFPGRN